MCQPPAGPPARPSAPRPPGPGTKPASGRRAHAGPAGPVSAAGLRPGDGAGGGGGALHAVPHPLRALSAPALGASALLQCRRRQPPGSHLSPRPGTKPSGSRGCRVRRPQGPEDARAQGGVSEDAAQPLIRSWRPTRLPRHPSSSGKTLALENGPKRGSRQGLRSEHPPAPAGPASGRGLSRRHPERQRRSAREAGTRGSPPGPRGGDGGREGPGGDRETRCGGLTRNAVRRGLRRPRLRPEPGTRASCLPAGPPCVPADARGPRSPRPPHVHCRGDRAHRGPQAMGPGQWGVRPAEAAGSHGEHQVHLHKEATKVLAVGPGWSGCTAATHARTHTPTRTHTSTCTRTHTLTRARAHSCTRTLTCTPARTHAHTRVLGGARCCWPVVSAALGGVERPLGAAFVCIFPAAHGLDHLPGAHSPSDLSFSEVSARALSARAGPPSRRGARERVRVPDAAPRGSCDLDAPPPRPTGLHSLTSAFPSPHAPNRVEIQFARVASYVSLSRRCCRPHEFGQNRLVCRKNGLEPVLAVYTRGERRPFSDRIGTTRP